MLRFKSLSEYEKHYRSFMNQIDPEMFLDSMFEGSLVYDLFRMDQNYADIPHEVILLDDESEFKKLLGKLPALCGYLVSDDLINQPYGGQFRRRQFDNDENLIIIYTKNCKREDE